MNLQRTKLHILRQAGTLTGEAKAGVSLHCHTEHSKEMLDFLPHYGDKIPIVSYFWQKEKKKYMEREGKLPDFSTAYWSPPLTSQMVYDIEKAQINSAGLDAFVSLTDHDEIQGNLGIIEEKESRQVPISLEWTVPFDFGFFHVGVHNLPKDRAVELTQTLLDYTFTKEKHSTENLNEMFSMLNAIPQVLIILNHPIWDIEMVGKEKHELLLKAFIHEHGSWIHAFEINGFRSWSENKAVIEMAEALGIPLASGGDRHGCQPNTVLNLTNTETFDEFVNEIRIDKKSQVVLMPEYEQPLHSRQLQSFSEILTRYPEFPVERQRWFDRIFFDTNDGQGLVPLSSHGWRLGGPKWLRAAVWTLGFLGSPSMRPMFRLARKKADRVPKDMGKAKFEIPDLDELSRPLSSGTV
ncbi:MAG: PHP domain-containing protein [Pyrinomonadaceae bacterium]